MKPGNSHYHKAVFLLVLIIAALLRTVNLSTNPNGLQIDEASIAVTGYLIAETGKDETGMIRPFYPQSTWNPKHPVYLYTSLISTKFLGVNEASARLPSAIFGIIAVIAVYYLAVELLSSVSIALMAAFLLAVSPWHTHFSRFAIEAPALPTIFTLGLLFLVKGAKGRPLFLIPGSVFMGMTFYTYPVSLVFVPLFLFCFLIIYRKQVAENLALSIVSAAIALVCFIPIATGFFAKTKMDSYFKYSSITTPKFRQVARDYLDDKRDPVSKWIASSDAALTAYGFATNYIGYFSPRYLFIKGDTQSLRHGTGKFGVELLACMPFLLAGFITIARRREKAHSILLCWMLLFPVSASLMTWGDQHAVRSIIALPCLQLVSALGFFAIYDWLSRAIQSQAGLKAAAIVLFLPALANAGIYFHYYFTKYPGVSAEEFNYGFREAFSFAEKNRFQVSSLIITNNIPYVYSYLFFYVPPRKDQVVWDPETGALDISATAKAMGYDICDVRTCMEELPHPALAIARPAQLPQGIYKNRKSPGMFSLQDVNLIRYKKYKPNLLLSLVKTSSK